MKKHLLRDLRFEKLAEKFLDRANYDGPGVRVFWNYRLLTTVGFARRNKNPSVELNPILQKGKHRKHLLCTFKHELAHILAKRRSGRKKIEAHGSEWRQACKDLGIPKEKPCHDIDVPRKDYRRKFFYICLECGNLHKRVRPYKTKMACIKCVIKHNGKAIYDPKFPMCLIKK